MVSKKDLANAAEKESKRLGLEDRYNWSEIFGLEEVVQDVKQKESTSPMSDARKTNDLNNKQDKSVSSDNNQVIDKYNTVGDGNCFFHAVFGENSSGVYETDRAQEMRQEWCKFLSQFESLNDPKMPEALKERLLLVFHNVFPTRESNFLTSDLYKQYLNKISEQGYFIYVEEVPILASLANTKVEIYSQNLASSQEIQPDPYMINAGYRRNQELWGSKERETIYLEGDHYSRARVIARSKKQTPEQQDFLLARQLQEQEDLLYAQQLQEREDYLLAMRFQEQEQKDSLFAREVQEQEDLLYAQQLQKQEEKDFSLARQLQEREDLLYAQSFSQSCGIEEPRVTSHQQQIPQPVK